MSFLEKSTRTIGGAAAGVLVGYFAGYHLSYSKPELVEADAPRYEQRKIDYSTSQPGDVEKLMLDVAISDVQQMPQRISVERENKERLEQAKKKAFSRGVSGACILGAIGLAVGRTSCREPKRRTLPRR